MSFKQRLRLIRVQNYCVRGVLAILILFGGLISAGGVEAGEAIQFDSKDRTWTDHTGEHSVDARLVEYQDHRVTLEKSDQSRIVLSIKRLSVADRQYLGTLLRAARNAGTGIVDAVDGTHVGDLPHDKRKVAVNAEADENFGIDWYDIEDSFLVATSSKKPIMWFRVLGDLNGLM